MLDVKRAYKIAKAGYILPRVLSCLDFKSFYLFSFAPEFVNINNGYLTGTIFDAVDKNTGKKFLYDISTDIEAYENAKTVEIETFLDEKI